MQQPPINRHTISQIKTIIKEYEAHDREAFENRTEMFKIMMAMANELERIYQYGHRGIL